MFRAVVCVSIYFRFRLELSSVGPSVAIHVGDHEHSGFGFDRASRNLVLMFVFLVSIYRLSDVYLSLFAIKSTYI